MGGDGTGVNGAVQTGAFSDASGWRVEVAADVNGVLRSVHRPLRRGFDTSTGLPNKSEVQLALDRPHYDSSPWGATSAGFRDRLEGWVPAASAPHLHNRVHVFVGGDMLISSSPNDPVFFLNHCNVDRVWASWQKQRPAEPYRPPQSAPQSLFRHRLEDPMYSIFAAGTNGPHPKQMLNVGNRLATAENQA